MSRRTTEIAVHEDEIAPESRPVGERFEAGTYDRQVKCFSMRIPAPPEARRIEFQDRPWALGDTYVGWEISAACPHCLKDVSFVFTRGYSEVIMRDLRGLRSEVEQLRQENRMLHAIALTQKRMIADLRSEPDPDATP